MTETKKETCLRLMRWMRSCHNHWQDAIRDRQDNEEIVYAKAAYDRAVHDYDVAVGEYQESLSVLVRRIHERRN